MVTVPTTCPFCACSCGLYLLAKEGELVGIAPMESHPVSSGKLCARGWSAHEAAAWGNRVAQPMVNRNGHLEHVSWDEAFDHVERGFKELLDARKPVGALGSPRATNEENYLAGKLARAGLKTNNLDFSFHSLCRSLFAGLEEVCGEYAPSMPLKNIESCEAILLIEGDVARSNPRAASSVMRALENGARLITIGSAMTQMARLASLHLPTMPGDEGETITAILAAVLALGMEDQASVALHCEGYEPLRHDVGSATTQEARQAAEWFARARHAVILIATTYGQGPQGQKDAAALVTLAAITGHLNKPGSGVLPLLPRSNVRGTCDMGIAPDRLPGYQRLDDPQARQRLQTLWRCELPSARGLDAEEMIRSVSGLICVADDPPSVLPMGPRAMGPLSKIEFLVVLDSFLTPTARLAHVLLPIASYAENEGTITNLEGRIQKLHAACAAPGESRSGWQVLAELCRRFSVQASYDSLDKIQTEVGLAAPWCSTIPREGAGGNGEGLIPNRFREKCHLVSTAPAHLTSPERPHVLARDGFYDWGRDPLVMFSPALNRDYLSLQKLYPNGFVEICKQDADRWGVHAGRKVKLSSAHGDAVVPVRVRADLKPGVLLVPYAFRELVSTVLGAEGVTAIKVEQA